MTGLCKVEPTPKGWFIEYIDRSPDALAKQAVSSCVCCCRANQERVHVHTRVFVINKTQCKKGLYVHCRLPATLISVRVYNMCITVRIYTCTDVHTYTVSDVLYATCMYNLQ